MLDGIGEFDPWQIVTGDVTGDGAVTQADIDIILVDMGLEGENLTIADGDLNGDGVVDALDLAIAMDHLGTQLIDVICGADGEPIVIGAGGEDVQIWRIPIVASPGCTGGPASLCCCPCGPECGVHECECDGWNHPRPSRTDLTTACS